MSNDLLLLDQTPYNTQCIMDRPISLLQDQFVGPPYQDTDSFTRVSNTSYLKTQHHILQIKVDIFTSPFIILGISPCIRLVSLFIRFFGSWIPIFYFLSVFLSVFLNQPILGIGLKNTSRHLGLTIRHPYYYTAIKYQTTTCKRYFYLVSNRISKVFMLAFECWWLRNYERCCNTLSRVTKCVAIPACLQSSPLSLYPDRDKIKVDQGQNK